VVSACLIAIQRTLIKTAVISGNGASTRRKAMRRRRCKHVVVASNQVVVAIGASVTAGLVAAGEGRPI
jgi:hypothetical protein